MSRAMTTPAPVENPWKKPTNKNVSEETPLTAASACGPRKLPTINESAVLYICWNKFPINNGIVKRIIFFL